jgi:hypothetical protein
MNRRGLSIAAMLAVVLLPGCARQQAAPPADTVKLSAALPAGLTPEASVLDLMLDFVDPNADDLWASVATISSKKGVEERRPRTDAEWNLARRRALTLAESANLLVVEGRQVAHPGQQLEEPGGEGDYTPAQAQAEIDKDRGSFTGFAAVLQESSRKLLAAIEKRDIDAFLEAGGDLDEACETCHRRFWYPKSPQLPGP